ncbi:hypothetical protein F511_45768 [Dorcoceras hygrometricum]|uniref:Uncharacterized protein n=1 Tax=Dorcoceras hygrometricum TaxID=472368 RepID=A0A2Z6ZV91_9LAMI|nr:hypothetical protein F511_45768 [Dorcoceras hygrometricum]
MSTRRRIQEAAAGGQASTSSARGGSIRSASVRNRLRDILGHRAPSIAAPLLAKAPSIGRNQRQRRNIIARMGQRTSRLSREVVATMIGDRARSCALACAPSRAYVGAAACGGRRPSGIDFDSILI